MATVQKLNNEELKAYTISNPVFRKGIAPGSAARPKDVSELTEIVAKANKDKLKLVPVSSTGPHQKSGIACSENHTMVDLTDWKEIPWINRRNRVVMIEPGVTYGELTKALEPHGMTVPTPLAPRSGKSVVASMMDREPHIWPNKQWDYVDPVASTELIFGTGDLFRTGSAGGPGSLEEQREKGGAQKCAEGPSQTNFQRVVQGSQGSMGLVTWITIRTELKPVIETPVLVGADDLEKLIAYVYEVQRPRLGEHTFIVDRMAASMLMTRDDISAFEKTFRSLPRYVCMQNIAGFEQYPEERVAYQLIDIKQIAKNKGLDLANSLDSFTAAELLDRARMSAGETDWRQAMRGHCLSLFFITTLDKTQLFIDRFEKLVDKHKVEADRIGTYIQPVLQNHACQVEFMVPFDPSNEKEIAQMKQLEAESVGELIKSGAFFSRPYGSAEKAAFEKNKVSYEFLKTTKNLFDPNRILNPGKFGL